MEIEIWKDVIGYDGMYQISSYGNVKSFKNNGEKILKKVNDGYGYTVFGLCKNGISKNIRGHVLVAQAFLNHVPNKFVLVVDHIDGNPSNNNITNLQLISHRDNVSKGYKNKSSKFRGVCWHKTHKRWIASGINNKFIGYFNSEIEAYNSILNYEKEM